MTQPPIDLVELAQIFREELRAELASWPELADVREGRKQTMTTPIDDLSLGQAAAEILERLRSMDERLNKLAAKPGAGAAPAPEPAALEPELVDSLLRCYGHLVKDVGRLRSRLETIEKHLGIDPDEELRKKLRQLDEKRGDEP